MAEHLNLGYVNVFPLLYIKNTTFPNFDVDRFQRKSTTSLLNFDVDRFQAEKYI